MVIVSNEGKAIFAGLNDAVYNLLLADDALGTETDYSDAAAMRLFAKHCAEDYSQFYWEVIFPIVRSK